MPQLNASVHPRPPRYRLVVLDVDGTLLDSFAFFVSVQNLLASRHGFRGIHADEVQALRAWSPRQLMRHTRLPLWKLPRVARDFRRLMAEDGGAVACFPGARDALKELHDAGVLLALVTSNSRENCERALGEASFRLFTHVECGAALLGKARRLRRALRQAGVAPPDAIYIGDQATDAVAARKAGIAFGAVAWGYATVEALRALHPAHVLTDFADLAALGRPRGRRP